MNNKTISLSSDESSSVQEPPPAPFRHKLTVTALGLLLITLAYYLLKELRPIFQPLCIALFIGYLLLPVHDWLVKRKLPSLLASGVILGLILLVFYGLGVMVFQSLDQAGANLPEYEKRLDQISHRILTVVQLEVPEDEESLWRRLPILQGDSVDQVRTMVRTALGTLHDFTAALAVVFIYLIFLAAEKASFSRRMVLAFGDAQGSHVMEVVAKINHAISQYLAVKTFVSFLAGFLSLLVLALFGVDFFLLWAVLIFLLNFIPYLGSLVAVALPILMSFLQFPEMWKGVVIGLLLVGIQQGIGAFLEPRLAGRRLGVSPLLILLSLSFWGLVWGIVGMILAVPLLMVVKIILENIKETRPIGTLMSNL